MSPFRSLHVLVNDDSSEFQDRYESHLEDDLGHVSLEEEWYQRFTQSKKFYEFAMKESLSKMG